MTGFYMKCNTELKWVNLFNLYIGDSQRNSMVDGRFSVFVIVHCGQVVVHWVVLVSLTGKLYSARHQISMMEILSQLWMFHSILNRLLAGVCSKERT